MSHDPGRGRRRGRHAAGRRGTQPLHPHRVLVAQLGAWRGVSLLIAALTLVGAAFLSATPVLQSLAEDRAVGDVLRDLPGRQRDLTLRLPAVPVPSSPEESSIGPGARDPFEPVDVAMRAALRPEVTRLLGEQSHSATSPSMLLALRRGSPLSVEHQQLVVRIQTPFEGSVAWSAGAAPTAPSEATTIEVTAPTGELVPRAVTIIPVAARDTTAAAYGLTVGDVVELRSVAPGPGPVVARISGVFTPVDDRDPLWDSDLRMLGIAKVPGAQGAVLNEAALIADASAYGALSDSIGRDGMRGGQEWRSLPLVHEWRYPLAPDRLARADVQPLQEALVRVQSDPRAWAALPEAPTVTTGLGSALRTYEAQVSGARAVTSFPFAGFTAAALLVLVLAALVGLQGRAAQLSLMRARGGSLARLLPLAVLSLCGLAVITSAVVVGVVAALTRRAPGPSTVAAVSLLVLVPAAVVAVAANARLRHGGSLPLARGRRLVVVEAGVVVLAALAVTTVRARGAEVAAGTTDWYVAVTPFLVAAAGAVVGIRVLSLVLGAAASVASRRPGLVAHLGLTRAARTGSFALVPLAALVVGTSLVTLLAQVSIDISSLREQGAHRSVGADVRVDGDQLGEAAEQALAQVPGVTATTLAHVATSVSVTGRTDTEMVHLVAADPGAYAALVGGGPVAFTAPAVMGQDPGEGPVPVLLSDPGLTGPVQLLVRGAFVDGVVVGHDPRLARVVNGRPVVVALVPLRLLAERVPLVVPNTVFVRTGDPRAVLALYAQDGSSFGPLVTEVSSASTVSDSVRQRALSTLVARSYLAAGLLSALVTALAVLLLLTVTRPDRSRLVARLRTMGLRRGGERQLAWVEVMPLVLTATLIGVAVGMVAPQLLSAALDLGPYTGGAPHPPLTPRWSVGLMAGALVVTLAALALAADAVTARRSALAETLRRGDSA